MSYIRKPKTDKVEAIQIPVKITISTCNGKTFQVEKGDWLIVDGCCIAAYSDEEIINIYNTKDISTEAAKKIVFQGQRCKYRFHCKHLKRNVCDDETEFYCPYYNNWKSDYILRMLNLC